MNILHTSDWHLGTSLYGRKRYVEFESFLNWLLHKIKEFRIDLLVVSGDIFDKSVPSNRAQELYYGFLIKVSDYGCRHVVIVAGNHDSPTFLDAPKGLLGALNVSVIGSAAEDPADEVITIQDEKGKPEILVCAVPYLRDRDIRQVEAGENQQDKEEKLVQGICSHYQKVCDHALELQTSYDAPVPILATGHLFTTGAKTIDGDGVRTLYVGSLARITAESFPKEIDYLALGHMHVPQKVGGKSYIRYCGSPYPIGFGEAKQEKTVILVQFEEKNVKTTSLPVPRFQDLEQIVGSWEHIQLSITKLVEAGSNAWLEIIYEGEDLISDLSERLDEMLSASDMEVLRVKNRRMMQRILNSSRKSETLDDLNVTDVFSRCLDAHDLPEVQKQELFTVFNEVLQIVYEEDPQGNKL